jgi:hypothetical protein
LFQYLFWRGFVQALFCECTWLLFRRAGLMRGPSFRLSRDEVRFGVLSGGLLAVASILVFLGLGQPLTFHFNVWSSIGNFFSNTYEEIMFRGFLLYGLMAATTSRWFAIDWITDVFV